VTLINIEISMENRYYAEHCGTCPYFFKLFNSCPNTFLLKTGSLYEISFELLMSLSSSIAYFAFFITMFYALWQKTTRGFCIATIIVIQVVACEIFKAIERQARPYGACADSFGYPSSHSSFASTLFGWLILEMIFLRENASFRSWKYYRFWRDAFLIYAPSIPYSRDHLNYHSIEQIVVGTFSGFVFASVFFFYIYFFVIHAKDSMQSPLTRLWERYEFTDNLGCKEKEKEKENNPQIMENIKELQKKYNLIHSVKNDLLKQKETLVQRLDKLQSQKKKK